MCPTGIFFSASSDISLSAGLIDQFTLYIIRRAAHSLHARQHPLQMHPFKKPSLLTNFGHKRNKSPLIAEQYLENINTYWNERQLLIFMIYCIKSADPDWVFDRIAVAENGHKSIHYIKRLLFMGRRRNLRQSLRQKEQLHVIFQKLLHCTECVRYQRRRCCLRTWIYQNGLSSMHFPLTLSQRRVGRAQITSHQPSFEYADSISDKVAWTQYPSLKEISAPTKLIRNRTRTIRTAARQKPVNKESEQFWAQFMIWESLEEQLLKSN